MRTVLITALLSLSINAWAAITITDPGQDVFDFTANAAELSGLAWLFGNTYHAVSDDTNQRKVYELNIGVNPTNGRITGASVAQAIMLATGYDLEGIAYCRPRGTWFISDEGQHPAGGFTSTRSSSTAWWHQRPWRSGGRASGARPTPPASLPTTLTPTGTDS